MKTGLKNVVSAQWLTILDHIAGPELCNNAEQYCERYGQHNIVELRSPKP